MRGLEGVWHRPHARYPMIRSAPSRSGTCTFNIPQRNRPSVSDFKGDEVADIYGQNEASYQITDRFSKQPAPTWTIVALRRGSGLFSPDMTSQLYMRTHLCNDVLRCGVIREGTTFNCRGSGYVPCEWYEICFAF